MNANERKDQNFLSHLCGEEVPKHEHKARMQFLSHLCGEEGTDKQHGH